MSQSDIVDYVFADVLGISKAKTKKLIEQIELNTVQRVLKTTEKSLQGLIDKKVISEIDRDMIVTFQQWMKYCKDKKENIPSSLEDWKTMLNEDVLMGFDVDKTESTIKPIGEQKAGRGEHFSIKFSDFPDFNGKHDTWNSFKEKFEATTALSSYDSLLNVTDIEEHCAKREHDNDYDLNVKALYSVLRKTTASGTALPKVTKYKETQDGVLAWKELKNYYDQDGDIASYSSKIMKQLLELHIDYNTHGGMEAYASKFEKYCQELNDVAPLSDIMKKNLFLQGIRDPDYGAKKDMCSLLPFDKCVQEMRSKAVELNKTDGPSRRPRHNNKKTSIYRKGNSETNDDEDEESEEKKNRKGSYFDEEVWSRMSPENKKYIMDLKKNAKKNEVYGNQYTKNTNEEEEKCRNIKVVNTTTTPEPDMPPTAPGSIWKPGILRKP